MTYYETAQLNINDLEEVEDNEVPEELIKRFEEFEEKPNPNLVETEVVNLGNAEVIQETRVSIHMTKEDKKEYTEFLIENKDIFAWSYADMTGLSTAIVAHRLPTDPACPPVKQKLRKYKPEMSLKNQRRSTKTIRCWDTPSDRIPNLACKCRSSAQERRQGQSLRGLPRS